MNARGLGLLSGALMAAWVSEPPAANAAEGAEGAQGEAAPAAPATPAAPSPVAPSPVAPSRAAAGSDAPAAEAAPESSSERAAPAPADTPDALLAEGIELRKAGDDRAALARFERAYALGGSARALAQLALAQQALGLWREAHEHLSRALSQADDLWIAEHRDTLEQASREIGSQLGSLEVICNVAGAEVLLHGRLLGRTPLSEPLLLVAGANVIQVRSEGHFEFARQVYIDARRLSRLNVVLTPNPASNASLGDPSAPRPGARGTDAGARTIATEADSSARDAFLYTSLGLSALGLTAGVTGFIVREVYVGQYNDDARCDQLLGPTRGQECADERAAFRAGEVALVAGFSAAAVFGLTAAYLWWDRPERGEEAARVDCGFSLAGAACQGRF